MGSKKTPKLYVILLKQNDEWALHHRYMTLETTELGELTAPDLPQLTAQAAWPER